MIFGSRWQLYGWRLLDREHDLEIHLEAGGGGGGGG